MRRFIMFVVLATTAAAVSAQGAPVTYAYSGPADQPVVSLDYQGSRLKRLTDEPTLSIYADGRVVMPQVYAPMHAYSGTLSQTELQGLLSLIIGKNKFFDFNEAQVKAQVAALPGARTTLPGDLATTVIKVNANYASKTVHYFGLGYDKTVQETEQLLAIRNRLDQIMSVMRLGGQEEATRWLDLANSELESKYPGVQRLDLDDLQSAAVYNDGSANVRFARIKPEQSRSVSVTISTAKSGKRTVTIARDDLLPTTPNPPNAASLSPLAVPTQLTFVFTYTDPAGVGFNDPTLGAARKAALDQTAALLESFFPGYPATINMSVDGANVEVGTLAAAGSNTNSANACDPGWGLGDTIDPGDYDFKSTLLHELMHAMGFAHSINQDGSSACSQAAGTAGAFNPYDQWIGDSTTRVIDPTTFILDGIRWGNVVTGGTGTAGAEWQGPQGIAGNGGQPVPLFSPTVYQAGSSISHLDDDFFTSAAYLMEAATAAGPGTRTLSNFEVGMLKDIGFANATNTPGNPDLIFANGFE